ncbi:hypothetical protein QNM97_18315 [Gordonia sp. L191]|uniref:hypothetical protein n=1 Tax=Gordonia sp. L191 TaxID=2982699 RepID=UPI0024BF8CF2|nr:hypothetical protein [Gordonia sp. L191]WHU45948.1 hypothetical protein QNM97_18315 [Gordonia sp. L191]
MPRHTVRGTAPRAVTALTAAAVTLVVASCSAPTRVDNASDTAVSTIAVGTPTICNPLHGDPAGHVVAADGVTCGEANRVMDEVFAAALRGDGDHRHKSGSWLCFSGPIHGTANQRTMTSALCTNNEPSAIVTVTSAR